MTASLSFLILLLPIGAGDHAKPTQSVTMPPGAPSIPQRLTRRGDVLSGPSRLYRCVFKAQWLDPSPVSHIPSLDLWQTPGRWNPDGQWALYTSHDPDVAVEEKRRHIVPRPRTAFGGIASFVGDPLLSEVVVFGFEAPNTPVFQMFDGRSWPSAGFLASMELCCYDAAHSFARDRISALQCHLIVPSSPCLDEWNSILYYFGEAQFELDDLPVKEDCWIELQAKVDANPVCP